MTDKKISELTGASTPLAGTEVLPVVQSGSTKKVSVANLTAGRSVAGLSFVADSRTTFYGGGFYDASFVGNNGGIFIGGGPSVLPSTGNGTPSSGTLSLGRSDYKFKDLFIAGNVVVDSGKGIDFAANGGDILTQYDEGTWTPAIAFGTNGDLAVTYSTQSGTYTRIGRQVTVSFALFTSSFTHTTASGALKITGLPFNAANTYQHTAAVTLLQGVTKANYTCFGFYANAGSKDLTSSASGSGQGWDNITAANMPTGGTVYIACTLTYFV